MLALVQAGILGLFAVENDAADGLNVGHAESQPAATKDNFAVLLDSLAEHDRLAR